MILLRINTSGNGNGNERVMIQKTQKKIKSTPITIVTAGSWGMHCVNLQNGAALECVIDATLHMLSHFNLNKTF